MKIPRDKRASIKIGGRTIPLPGNRPKRTALGAGLVAGGILGFLPVVGFWMLPLGLLVLSVDSKTVRRGRRRAELRWGKWRKARRDARSTSGEGGV